MRFTPPNSLSAPNNPSRSRAFTSPLGSKSRQRTPQEMQAAKEQEEQSNQRLLWCIEQMRKKQASFGIQPEHLGAGNLGRLIERHSGALSKIAGHTIFNVMPRNVDIGRIRFLDQTDQSGFRSLIFSVTNLAKVARSEMSPEHEQALEGILRRMNEAMVQA